MKAIRSPLGETRGWPIQPPVSYSGFPMGYSSRLRPPKSRTTARFVPSADQSAHCTCSSTSRGAPPDQRGARQRAHIHPGSDGFAVQQDRHFRRRRYRHQLSAAQAHGARLRRFGTRGEDVDGTALPCGAVENGLPVRSKARRANAATAEGKLAIHWRRQRRGGENLLAGVKPSCQRNQYAGREQRPMKLGRALRPAGAGLAPACCGTGAESARSATPTCATNRLIVSCASGPRAFRRLSGNACRDLFPAPC